MVRRRWRQLWREWLDAVVPSACAACGASAATLCSDCQRDLRVRPGGCVRCGEPMTPAGRCTANHDAYRHLRRLVAPFVYAGTAGRLVRRFKLDGDAAAGRLLARAMANALRSADLPGRPVVVSVPLHRARRRQRGFDQAHWRAQFVAAQLGLRGLSGVLVRRRATKPQGDARVLSRVENVRGAFAVQAPEVVRRRVVVLVDDVFTTGATARACARILRQAGARNVVLLVACQSR